MLFYNSLCRVTPPHPSTLRQSHTSALKSNPFTYFVPRNTNGRLPVYTDIRNNGTRYRTLIRNVDGQAHALARDLRITLFKAASPKLTRASVEVGRSQDIIITAGGSWKSQVVEWLKARGF